MEASARIVRRCLRSEDAATAVEYCLIAAGIALAIATVIFQIGSGIDAYFDQVATAL